VPPSKNLSSYSDVYQFLEAALANKGSAEYPLPTSGKAKNFVFRINVFLKLLREKQETASGNPFSVTRYDALSFTIPLAGEPRVTARARPAAALTFFGEDGKPLDNIPMTMETTLSASTTPTPPAATAKPSSTFEDLDNFAANFARSQGIEPD
jgi:hypothetical protein